MRKTVIEIDAKMPGSIGVYIKRLNDGTRFRYDADKRWYLASTTKIPVAIALLQKVEEGSISLDYELTLKKSDYVDGAGVLLAQKTGTRVSVRQLLENMITRSDSTAADMLIRLLGESRLNGLLRERMVSEGFGPITTLLQVRRDAYAELHSNARRLTNLDFIELKRIKGSEKRLRAFLSKLNVDADDLKVPTIDEAFERYYERGLNSATLDAFGLLLEKLVQGELLSEKNTELVLGLMEETLTGGRRIKAGLPKGAHFAQKTGTQVRRICNVGIIRLPGVKRNAVVIASCMEKFPDQAAAEAALKRLGLALSRSRIFLQE